MIDIKYVQERLDQVKVDSSLPLRSWVRDLITKVRELETAAHYTDIAINEFKETVNYLQDNVQYWENRVDDLEKENENNS